MSDLHTAPSEFNGRLAQGKDWREIVAWVGDLPPMPKVASRAIALVESPNTSAAQLAELLQSDTALAVRVLKIANSAMFARQREITTLNQAIGMIGFKALKGVIVAAALRQMNRNFANLEQLVWENSMASAICATKIAKHLKKSFGDEIFLLGLLHTLGQVVLLARKETQQDYLKVIETIKVKNIDYVAAEQEVFGFAHPLIGALVAKKWNFSADTCQVILHYHDTVQGTKPEFPIEEKTSIVKLADMLAHLSQVGSPEGYPDLNDQAVALATYLGFDKATAKETLTKLIEEGKAQFLAERHIYE